MEPEEEKVLGKRTTAPKPFVPAFVRFDKKVLTFYGYFCERIDPKDNFFAENANRFRYVNVYYHLENDTMSAIEPIVQNSGLVQGKFLRRSKVVKKLLKQNNGLVDDQDEDEEFWHWKDLRLGLQLLLNGITIKLIDCDSFTKKFFESHDIDLGRSEAIPIDNYSDKRETGYSKTHLTPTRQHNKRKFDDKFLKLLEFNDDKLCFQAIWDDPLTQQRKYFELYYYLADGTCSLRDRNPLPIGTISKETSSFPLFLRRQKLPKNRLADTATTAEEYLGPEDFRIGQTVDVFGRELLVYECSEWTRKFYRNRYDFEQPQKLDFILDPFELDCLEQPKESMKLANGNEEQQHGNRIRKLYADSHQILRYGLELVESKETRTFVLSYRLSDGQLQICETFATSKQRPERFLHYCYVRKTQTGAENEPIEFYEPDDFRVGCDLRIYGRLFRIVSADLFVWRFIEQNLEKFSHETIANIRDFFQLNGTNDVNC